MTSLGLSLLLAFVPACAGPDVEPLAFDSSDRHVADLSGDGWRLWLDRAAPWKDDALLPPPVDLVKVPANKPTGGWAALQSGSIPVSVPGTVEEHLPLPGAATGSVAASAGATDGDPPGGAAPADQGERGEQDIDYVGVSWWTRSFEVPAEHLRPGAGAPRRVLLRFEAVRLRAEVFVNQWLVGYDAVGNTPFEVDATPAVHAGTNTLAVRITDPGGNFDWVDFDAHRWGAHTIPASHGFGGITGPVSLRVVDPVRIEDVFVQNTPDVREVQVQVTVQNGTDRSVDRDLVVTIWGEAGTGGEGRDGRPLSGEVLELAGQRLVPGVNVLSRLLEIPNAELWTPATPRLYRCTAALRRPERDGRVAATGDAVSVRFGFRWFEPVVPAPEDSDAVFRLNGERIVLRSAISWGFWPISGMVPTPELMRRQVESAKALGLNMLNHHRCIAAPGLLDVQDELGLLAYEEPGGYTAHGGDELCAAFAREKLLRMVRRDRNHPSLVIVNMINEETAPPSEAARRDLLDARALDPTRTITYTSGWARGDGDEPIKLHVRPGDETPHTEGWYDYHNAPGPGVWRDEFWQGPGDHLRATDDRREIVFWGEEGAIAAPPRLQLIDRALDQRVAEGKGLGWDGAAYRERYAALAAWLRDKGFARAFPDVDALTVGLGNVAYDYQRRAIETVRVADVSDGYVINGWEDSKLENHSGIVDCWRQPKGNPSLLARANAPVTLVARLRNSVVGLGAPAAPGEAPPPVRVTADVGLINELDLEGRYRLKLWLWAWPGAEQWSETLDVDVEVEGGENFGQMLAAGLEIEAPLPPGPCKLSADLRTLQGEVVASGEDDLWVVDWRAGALPSNGAVLEQSHALRGVFRELGVPEAQAYFESLPRLDYVLVGDFDPEPQEPIPAEQLFREEVTDAGPHEREGLDAVYFADEELRDPTAEASHPTVDFEWLREEPAPDVPRTHFSLRLQGKLRAPDAGTYLLHTLSDDGVRLWVDGALLIDNWSDHPRTTDHAPPLEWATGSVHELRLEYRQGEGDAALRLLWTPPARSERARRTLDDLLRRAREDGTTVAFLDHAGAWAERLSDLGAVQCDGVLQHGNYWLGGGFFVREHPLFDGLPVNAAMAGPYQDLVKYEARRSGLLLRGEEAVVGCLTGHDPRVATAVGIVQAGKGRLLLSTLDVVGALKKPGPATDVVRKYVCNVVAWAGASGGAPAPAPRAGP